MKDELLIIIRGGPASGKTTIGKALGDRFIKSACIEQDVLRYMIRGGLVAAREGGHPTKNPKEYFNQCRLGDRNALALARNFVEAGYVVIISGLNAGESSEMFLDPISLFSPSTYPDIDFFKTEVPGINFFQVFLECQPDVLTNRLIQRGFDNDTIKYILDQQQFIKKHIDSNAFQLTIDTSSMSIEHCVNLIFDSLNERIGDSFDKQSKSC